MKATSEQREFIRGALVTQLTKLNLTIQAITCTHDCWTLLHRQLSAINDWPFNYGNPRDWKLEGLDDSHIDTVFKYILKQSGKIIA